MKRIGILPSGHHSDLVVALKDVPDFILIVHEPRAENSKSQVLFAIVRSIRYRRRDLAEIVAWLRKNQIDLVLTLDNNPIVSHLARLIDSPIMVIQHGVRRTFFDQGKLRIAKNLTFCSWGELQVQDAAKNLVPAWPNALHAIQPTRIVPVGSLRDDLAVLRSASVNRSPHFGKFDLCLVSQFKGEQPRELHEWQLRQRAIGIVAKWTSDFVQLHNLKLVVAGYGDTPETVRSEQCWLREHLNCKYEYVSPRTEVSSYLATEAATVTVGVHSSVIWEAFGRRRRILSVNPTDETSFNFPIRGPWAVRSTQFDEFRRALERVLDWTDDDYEKQIGDYPDQIAVYRRDESVRSRILRELDRSLKSR